MITQEKEQNANIHGKKKKKKGNNCLLWFLYVAVSHNDLKLKLKDGFHIKTTNRVTLTTCGVRNKGTERQREINVS